MSEQRTSSPSRPLRVGLLGASSIGRQVWAAIHETGHVVTFIGCRDPTGSGQRYRDEMLKALGIPTEGGVPMVGTYNACVTSDEVDLVYISIPVTARTQWVMRCVEYGKHVVGEKPPAESAEVLRGWIEALDAKQLLYMDGTMFSHGARVKAVAAQAKEMGPVKQILSNFSFAAPPSFFTGDIRMDPSLEPQGALGDLGWYNIRYILHVMDMAMPAEVTGRIVKACPTTGAIIEFSGDLTFIDAPSGERAVASIFCAFDVAPEQTLHIATRNGILELGDFVHCAEGRPAQWLKVVSAGGRDGPTNFTRTRTEEVCRAKTAEETKTQKLDMWRNIAALLYRDDDDDDEKKEKADGADGGGGGGGRLKARPEGARYWATVAWKTQAIMDKMLESARQHARV